MVFGLYDHSNPDFAVTGRLGLNFRSISLGSLDLGLTDGFLFAALNLFATDLTHHFGFGDAAIR